MYTSLRQLSLIGVRQDCSCDKILNLGHDHLSVVVFFFYQRNGIDVYLFVYVWACVRVRECVICIHADRLSRYK